MKIMISGFEPFQEHKINPSQDVLGHLPKNYHSHEIYTALLPVTYKEAFSTLKISLDKVRPDFVIALGLGSGRTTIDLERIAINMADSTTPDNNGQIIVNQKIDENGPDAFFSTLPLQSWVKSHQLVNISNTAGTYVCNYLMYKLMQLAKEQSFKAGFIHLPCKLSLQETSNTLLELIEQL